MTTVNALELKNLLREVPGLILVYVQPPPTTFAGWIPGSVHLPWTWLKEKATGLFPDKHAFIAVYGVDFLCEASSRAAAALELLGYTEVYNFTDGLKGWQNAGYPLVGDAPTQEAA